MTQSRVDLVGFEETVVTEHTTTPVYPRPTAFAVFLISKPLCRGGRDGQREDC